MIDLVDSLRHNPCVFAHNLGWETPQSRERAHSACSKNPSTRVDTISIGYSTSNRIKSEANQTVSMKKNEKKNNNQTERAGGDTN